MNTSRLLEVASYNFEQEVEECLRPVIVLVHNDGRLICKEFRKVVEEASLTHDRHFKFCVLDAKKNPELAQDICNSVIPSCSVYYKGKPIATLSANPDLAFYRAWLNRQLTDINRLRYKEQKAKDGSQSPPLAQ